MGDSVSDIIFIAFFACLVFFLNMRRQKKEKASQKDLYLEKREETPRSEGIFVQEKSDIEKPMKKNVAFEEEVLKKSLLSDQNNYKGKRLSEKGVPFEPKKFTHPVISSSAVTHSALVDSPIFSKEFSLDKESSLSKDAEEPHPSNLGAIAEKAGSKDMVILSAIYFTPYI